MFWMLLLCLALVFSPGMVTGFIGIAFALYLLFYEQLAGDVTAMLLLFSFVFSYPLCAYLTSTILDRFSVLTEFATEGNARHCTGFGVLFAATLMLSTDAGVSHLASVAQYLILDGSELSHFGAWLSLANIVVFCSVVAASAVCFSIVVFELSFRWTLAAGGASSFTRICSCWRSLLVILILSLSLQLVIGLFLHELHPARWLSR